MVPQLVIQIRFTSYIKSSVYHLIYNFMPRQSHSQSFMEGSSGIRLSQTEKMQKEADFYTKKYEWERRNMLTLQTIESKLSGEIANLKKNLGSLKKESEEGDVKLIFTKMRNLQKQVDMNDKRYNETVGEIEKLRKDIQQLRHDKTMYQHNLTTLQVDIDSADQQINALTQTIKSSQNTSNLSQNLMLTLKMKNEEDKTNYYRRLAQLNKGLKDPKLDRGSRIKVGETSAMQNNSAATLKQRLTKFILNNKEKVKLIDRYQRNMKVIDQAFNTIKEATGLTDIVQIQNTFIKGEEQNYNLLTYVDVLNQEIDNRIDINHNLRAKNQQLKKDNLQKQRILNQAPEDERRKNKIRDYAAEKKQKVEDFQKMLDQLSPPLKEVLLKLASSKFNRNNPHRAQEHLTSEVSLNHSNLGQYLSELEEYINDILVCKGRANKMANSDIYAKTLLLDQLTPKQFKKRTHDNVLLHSVLEQVKDKTKGIQKLLEREQLLELSKKQFEAKKQAQGTKKKK